MSIYYFLPIFIPVGLAALFNPYGLSSKYREALVKSGLPDPFITAIAIGWILVGASALVVLTKEAFGSG